MQEKVVLRMKRVTYEYGDIVDLDQVIVGLVEGEYI